VCQTGTFIVNAIGTSMASPHVAGLAALLAADNNGRASGEIRSSIFNADDLGDPGNDPKYGNGRINVARALGLQ
jgi:thermitase